MITSIIHKLPVLDALENTRTGEVRVAFQIFRELQAIPARFTFVVVKLFGPEAKHTASVKFWAGDYETTKSFWRTDTELSPVRRRESISLAKDRLALLFRNVEQLERGE